MQKQESQTKGKRKFALWIRQSVLDEVARWYEADNCSSQSEYIEKAVLFYTGYLASGKSQDYISQTLSSTLRGMLSESESRICRMLFKLTVELSMTMNIIAATHAISQSQLRELRATCVNEVKRTNGSYSLKDAVDLQKG